MIRFGIIGAGRIGKVHARSISQHPDAKLVAISDPNLEAAEELGKEYGCAAVTEAPEIFTNEDIDAVVVCSPTPLHGTHISEAVKAGKAVLCEKPISMDTASVTTLEKDLEEYNPRVMLGFNRRFDPNFAQIHDLVSKDEIGEVEQLTIISRDPAAPPKEYIAVSGGIFKDMTIHDFDMARFFLGDITEVTAIGQNLDPELADTGDFDAAIIVLKNAAGKVATIINSRHCASGYDQRLEAFGPKGSLFAENVRPTTVRLSNAKQTNALDPYLDFFLERYEDAYFNELDTFIKAIEGEGEFSPSIADGIAALKVAEAADESAKTGAPVSL